MKNLSLLQDPKSRALDKDLLFAKASIQTQNDVQHALEFQRNVFENKFPSDVSFLCHLCYDDVQPGATQLPKYPVEIRDPCSWLDSAELLSRSILMHVINHREKFLF